MSDSNKNQNNAQNISFSILGDNFSLRCREDLKESLEEAVAQVQALSAKILRDNPNLKPQQAAILCALETQSKLIQIKSGATPFASKAQSTLNKVYNNLNEINRSIEKIHNK